jgi:TPR repeat protein
MGNSTMTETLRHTFRLAVASSCLLAGAAHADVTMTKEQIQSEMDRAQRAYYNQEMMDAALIYKKLAMLNYFPAQTALGYLLDYTEASDQAVGWYIMAAFQGDATGAYALGNAYITGAGIKKDPAQALYWTRFAADKGNLNAIKVLESAYRRGETSGLAVKVDIGQAEYWKSKRIPLQEAEKKERKEAEARQAEMKKQKEEETKKTDAEAAAKRFGKGD